MIHLLQIIDKQEAFNNTTKHSVVKKSTTISPPTERNLEILRGRDGRDGRDGLTGPRGVTGPPGQKGETGVPGLKGDTGVPGPKGDTGVSNTKGETGVPGPKGETGIPGTKGDTGVPGTKGDKGFPGPKGDTGVSGPKGETGVPGTKGDTGVPGTKGHTGFPGPKGDTGAPGSKGDTGVPANKGDTGVPGNKGETGAPGAKGDIGVPAVKGDRGVPGTKGDRGVPGTKGDRGVLGTKGDRGVAGTKGDTGVPGAKGDKGVPGPKGDGTGGVVYVRWGHNTCPDSGAQLVYAGRAGGPNWNQRGGGDNPQCLPLDPNFYKTISGAQRGGYIYGAEYQDTNRLVANSHNTDVPCAVCYVPTRNVLYMIPAKYTCPSGWTREYFGYLMSERIGHYRSQFSCVDYSLKPVSGSSQNHHSFLFYTVEGVCGSLPCPPYNRNKELSCAVCTK